MASPKHLKILKQGTEVWNKWREDNSDIKANLKEADLRGADLSWANLSGAYLRMANLLEANLEKADLSGADLFRANLNGAFLESVNLVRADLRGANLGMSKFIIADITNPKSSPLELQATMPDYPNQRSRLHLSALPLRHIQSANRP